VKEDGEISVAGVEVEEDDDGEGSEDCSGEEFDPMTHDQSFRKTPRSVRALRM